MARAGFPDLFGKGALNSRELRKLQRLATPVRFRSGQQIVAEGETASEVYGLSQGVVRVYKKLADGRHHVLRFALPGDFLELPRGECHGLSAEAIGAVSASRFARCELFEFIQASRTMTRLMIDFAAEELKRSQDHGVARPRHTGGTADRISGQLAQAPAATPGQVRLLADVASRYRGPSRHGA